MLILIIPGLDFNGLFLIELLVDALFASHDVIEELCLNLCVMAFDEHACWHFEALLRSVGLLRLVCCQLFLFFDRECLRGLVGIFLCLLLLALHLLLTSLPLLAPLLHLLRCLRRHANLQRLFRLLLRYRLIHSLLCWIIAGVALDSLSVLSVRHRHRSTPQLININGTLYCDY